MQLTYRGQTYTPSHLPTFTQSVFAYRGQSYQNSHEIASIPANQLTYRGVPYIQADASLIPTFNPAFN